MNYRIYRLLDTNSRKGRSVSKHLGLQSYRFVKLFQKRLFNGSNLLDVIEFLSSFKKHCDQNDVSEGIAVELFPETLQGNALSHFKRNVKLEANRSAAINSYPAAVNLHLETYASNTNTDNSLYHLEIIVQFDAEEERQFGDRLQESARSFGGGICDEKNIINCAVR